MTDQTRSPRRGCGCLSLVASVVALALAVGVFLGVLAEGHGGLLSALPDGVQLPVAVTKAAEEFGSRVATSARSLASTPGTAATENQLRMTRPHIVPVAGKAVAASPLRFQFDGVKYSVTPHVATSVYWGAKRSTRLLTQLPGESNASWTSAYYHSFADDPQQTPAIDDVASQLRAIRAKAGLDSDQYLELIAKYVQSIPYDWKTYDSGAGKQRFVVETLVEGTGLCGDKSVLLADLLAHEGYSAGLLEFGPEKHMAVGVIGPGKSYRKSGYLFLETTSPCYVTDVPSSYSGGMRLRSEPVVVAIGTGTQQYSAADEIGKIVAVRDSAQKASDRLYKSAKSQSLTNAQVAAVNRKLDQAYRAQTSLRSNVVDHDGKSVGTFMDRSQALHWIDSNAWWL